MPLYVFIMYNGPSVRMITWILKSVPLNYAYYNDNLLHKVTDFVTLCGKINMNKDYVTIMY